MKIRLLTAAMVLMAGPLFAQGTPAPEGAEVYFVTLEDGMSVSSPVPVRFGLSGMGVAPAGVEADMTGHHHLFLDRAPFGEGEFGEEEASFPIPNDETHRHFGGGQTQVMIDLPPGEHTMQLVLGDHNHVPHDPPIVSDVITITVE